MSDAHWEPPPGERFECVIGGLPWQWDLSRGSLRHCGMPVVALWVEHSVGSMLRPLRNEIGPALSDLLIASSRREGAETDFKAIASHHGQTFEEGFAGWSKAVASAGWGVFTLLEFDRGARAARVRVNQPWELELKVGVPASCPFIQGKLIGLFSIAFETSCWAYPVAGAAGEGGYVDFAIEPSRTTIAGQIEQLRQARMAQSERELAQEVDRQTKALKSLEASQRSILNSLGDLVVTLNADGIVEQYLLPSAGAAGFPAVSEAIGRTLDQVFGQAFSQLNRQLSQAPNSQLTVSAQRLIGSETRHYNARASLRRNAKEQIEGLTLVIRDVTIERQLEQELRARQSLQNLEQLANGIAHDFNNVLHTVLSAAELIQCQQDAETDPLAQSIIDATESAAGLVKRMQALTSLQPHDRLPVSFDQVIEKCVRLFRQQAGDGIVVNASLDAKHHCIVGDENQLEHMMLNLCLNAKEAMPEGGCLSIRTTEFVMPLSGEAPVSASVGAFLSGQVYVALSVEDSGCGMDEETVRRIFQPFFTTRPGNGGTGLGMLGIESAVTAHNGAISIESVPNKGSRFVVYLPVEQNGGVAPSVGWKASSTRQ
ncbi:MAG: nitrogen regulation protein NR(II) [Burkholderiaceae bacterium]